MVRFVVVTAAKRAPAPDRLPRVPRTARAASAPPAPAGPRSDASAGESAAPTAEDFLLKATAARTPSARARWVRKGLAARQPLDKTTHAMLLRQLSLALYEQRKFDRAREAALSALELGVLVDVLHQDAARAAVGARNVDAAVAHLRVAARVGPASRRPFHHWTLGSLLFLSHRYAEAAAALERAVRWGTRDKPLYRAHLALVRIAAGERIEGLQTIIDELAAAACGQGYGRFVLGHLAYAAGAWAPARRYLEAFLRRNEAAGGARPALELALAGEIKMSRATLAKMSSN